MKFRIYPRKHQPLFFLPPVRPHGHLRNLHAKITIATTHSIPSFDMKSLMLLSIGLLFSSAAILPAQNPSIALDNTLTGATNSATFSLGSGTATYPVGGNVGLDRVIAGLRFNTGTDSTFLKDVTVPLVESNIALSGLTMELWDASGAGGFFGNLLYATNDVSRLTSPGSGKWNNYGFIFAEEAALDADTQYWLVARTENSPATATSTGQVMFQLVGNISPAAATAYPLFQSDLGWTVDGALSGRRGSASSLPDSYAPNVWTVTAITPVPEPSGALLSGITGVLSILRRRRLR